MEVYFTNTKLQKELQDRSRRQRKHGPRRAGLLQRRLDDLVDAETLEEMRPPMPGRCHELTGDRKGQIALDLDHPYRLIFEPYHDPIPRKADGGIDWKAITAVLIIGVEDYHD